MSPGKRKLIAWLGFRQRQGAEWEFNVVMQWPGHLRDLKVHRLRALRKMGYLELVRKTGVHETYRLTSRGQGLSDRINLIAGELQSPSHVYRVER